MFVSRLVGSLGKPVFCKSGYTGLLGMTADGVFSLSEDNKQHGAIISLPQITRNFSHPALSGCA